jgi:hypothetical protein
MKSHIPKRAKDFNCAIEFFWNLEFLREQKSIVYCMVKSRALRARIELPVTPQHADERQARAEFGVSSFAPGTNLTEITERDERTHFLPASYFSTSLKSI